VERVPLRAGSLAFGPDGRTLFEHTEEGVHVVDLTGDQRYLRQRRPADRRAYPEGWTSWFPSPSGEEVVWDLYHADGTRTVQVRDLRRGRTTDVEGFEWGSTPVWRPDGERIAGVDFTGRVRVADPADGRVVAEGRVDASDFEVWLAYLPDGRSLIAGADDGWVVLDAGSLRPLTSVRRMTGRNVAFAVPGPDPGTAVVLSRDRPTNFWDFTAAHSWALVEAESGEVLREGTVRPAVSSAAVSPDGRRLALGGDGLAVVDLRTGRATTADTSTAQERVAWSPDGATVVSSGDGRVHLWDGRTATALGDVAYGGADASPVFVSDTRVLVPSWDGAVYEWDTSLGHARAVGCRIADGGLDREEWELVLPDQPYQDTCA
jgi:WD40 repeat protein